MGLSSGRQIVTRFCFYSLRASPRSIDGCGRFRQITTNKMKNIFKKNKNWKEQNTRQILRKVRSSYKIIENRVNPPKVKACDTVHRHLNSIALFERNITGNNYQTENNRCEEMTGKYCVKNDNLLLHIDVDIRVVHSYIVCLCVYVCVCTRAQ